MATVMNLVGENKRYTFKSVLVVDAATENGSAIYLDSTVALQKDVYTGVKPATANLGSAYGLVAKEFIAYIGNEVIDKMVVNANEIVKVVILDLGQEVVLTSDAITGLNSVGAFVSPVNGSYKMLGTLTQTPAVIAYKIISTNETIRIGQRSIAGIRLIRIA